MTSPLASPLRRSATRRALLLGGVAFAVAGGPARAATIAGVSFEDRIRLAGSELQLNGVGVRAVAWFQGYAAALYLPQRSPSAEAALAVPGPKRVRMKMLVEVESKEFAKAVDKGVRRNNTEAEQAALRERVQRFDRTILEIGVLKKGDVIDLDWLPGRGFVLAVNGRERGEAIAGEDMYRAILKIFLGPDPVDKKLKAGLLGGD